MAAALRTISGLCALALAFVAFPAQALPSFAEVRTAYRESDAWLLARDGQPLQALRLDHAVRRLPWTPLAAVSPALTRALVASEDRRFYDHGGIDWEAVAASAWGNLWRERGRGASTLTMQLAGLLDEDIRQRGRRSVLEKLGQAAAALRLERSWRKDEILEAYLNLAGFRGELQGIAAMSRGLFGKWPDGLDERESAIAVALLRGPGAGAEPVAARACAILLVLGRPPAACDGLPGLARLAFSGGLRTSWLGGEQSPELAPHLARKLLARPGERLTTTLDARLQRFATDTLRRHLRELAPQNVQDGAVLVVDNASGEIRAWVGSSGGLSSAPEVDALAALRQAGSTLKPFLYGLAFERRTLTAASLVDDSPASLATAGGLYIPQNYSPEYRGWVSARQALAGSLNVPAVRTLVRVGTDAFHARLQDFGFASLREGGDYYGYSLALGSADVSPLMLANAYRTLANGGRWTPLRATADGARVPCREGGCAGVFTGPARQAAPAAPTFIVADILADRAARAATFGLESWLATPYWSAAKTGTSKDMRDNWCAGFSRRHTVLVWVGNAGGEAMHDVSGTSGAAPVWREIMDWLHRETGAPAAAPAPPAGLVRRPVRFEPPREPSRQEWFLGGTAVAVVQQARAATLARIAYPADGTVIALDPDIPPGRQRIALRLTGSAGPGWRWRLDAAPPLPVTPSSLWLPVPGTHRLVLEDAGGRAIDAVGFSVRALRGKTRQ